MDDSKLAGIEDGEEWLEFGMDLPAYSLVIKLRCFMRERLRFELLIAEISAS